MELVIFIVAIVTMIANIMSAYYARKSILQGGAMESRNSPPLWRFYIVPVLSTLLVCAAVGFDVYDRHSSVPDITQDISIMEVWGPNGHVNGIVSQVQVVADGKRLLSYQSDYRLAAMCFHNFGTIDQADIAPLQKSALYDIRKDDVLIVIALGKEFIDEWKNGARGTTYLLFLVPKGVTMDQFSTIRQATALGVIQLQGGYGLP